MIMKFNDGIEFNTDGPLRIERRRDGYYVVGKGGLCPVDSYEDGRRWIELLEEANKSSGEDITKR